MERDWIKEIEEAAELMRSPYFPRIAEGYQRAANLLVDLVKEIKSSNQG